MATLSIRPTVTVRLVPADEVNERRVENSKRYVLRSKNNRRVFYGGADLNELFGGGHLVYYEKFKYANEFNTVEDAIAATVECELPDAFDVVDYDTAAEEYYGHLEKDKDD